MNGVKGKISVSIYAWEEEEKEEREFGNDTGEEREKK